MLGHGQPGHDIPREIPFQADGHLHPCLPDLPQRLPAKGPLLVRGRGYQARAPPEPAGDGEEDAAERGHRQGHRPLPAARENDPGLGVEVPEPPGARQEREESRVPAPCGKKRGRPRATAPGKMRLETNPSGRNPEGSLHGCRDDLREPLPRERKSTGPPGSVPRDSLPGAIRSSRGWRPPSRFSNPRGSLARRPRSPSDSFLPACESRGTLLEEGGHAFLHVFRRGAESEERGLVREPLRERHL